MPVALCWVLCILFPIAVVTLSQVAGSQDPKHSAASSSLHLHSPRSPLTTVVHYTLSSAVVVYFVVSFVAVQVTAPAGNECEAGDKQSNWPAQHPLIHRYVYRVLYALYAVYVHAFTHTISTHYPL
jgi:hypothetical protein